MKSYFAYIRVSTVKQGEHGSSLQEQRDSIETYARRAELRIAQWFEETETAAKQGRTAFNLMLAELERGRAAGVIIHKIDRSARNLRDWARLGELMDVGTDVRFVHDNLDLSTRGGRLSADIQAVVAADFVRNLRDEVRKGQRGRLKQGLYPFNAPRGYLDRGRGRRKEIDPAVAPLVREAFELYGTGRYGLHELRREMALRGLRSARGGPLGLNAISLLLRNPFYAGIIKLRGWTESFEGAHEPLVSQALFRRVQEILSGRLYPRFQRHHYLFRRLIKCAGCGRSLTGERQKGRVYYRCHDLACRGVSVSEEAVDKVAKEALATLRIAEEDIGDFREVLRGLIAAEDGERANRVSNLTRERALVEERLARLTDALLDGIIDRETYDARKTLLLQRRSELRDALEGRTDLSHAKHLAELFELGFVALPGYETATDAEKREILQSLGSNFVVHAKSVEFPMHFPFSELQLWSADQGGAPYRDAVRTTTRDKKRVKLRRFVTTLARKLDGDSDRAG